MKMLDEYNRWNLADAMNYCAAINILTRLGDREFSFGMKASHHQRVETVGNDFEFNCPIVFAL